MKYLLLIIFIISSISFNKASADDIKNPSELFKKMQEAYKNIKSYSYTNEQGEYDTFSKEYQKETADKYGDLNKKYGDGKNSKVSDKPEYKKGLYQVNFVKPYSIKMKIISSDYTPSVLNNADFIYRPDINAAKFTIKIMGLGFIPLDFERSITEENTGDFLVMNWTIDLLQIDYFFRNVEGKIKGKIKFGSKDMYLLEFKFPKNFKPVKVSYKSGDIPSQVKPKIDYALGSLERVKYSSVKFWIDANNFIVIKKEEYRDDKLYSSRKFSNITLNNITKNDLK